MAFHLVAFGGSTTGETVAARPYTMSPITDMYLPSTPTGFLLPSPMSIVAAYAVGFPVTEPTDGAGLLRASIVAPSLLRVAYPYIRPVSRNYREGTDPNVMNLVSAPLTLPASESVGIQAVVEAAENSGFGALLWFADRLIPAPAGERFTLRFATTLTATPAAGGWSPIGTVTFDQSLPPGTYTVIGFEHWCPRAFAARLVFPGMAMRPGTLSMTGEGDFPADKRTDRLFYEGGLGVYGSFNSFAPPSIEVIINGEPSDADQNHEAYLTVVRTGDAGSLADLAGGAPQRPGVR